MEIIPADTSPEIARMQWTILRRMSGAKRLQIACSLSDSLRELVASGIRHRHSHYTEEQVKLAVGKLTIGEELFRQAYPDQDIQV